MSISNKKSGLLAVAWRDKCESNPILTWQMLTLGLVGEMHHFVIWVIRQQYLAPRRHTYCFSLPYISWV